MKTFNYTRHDVMQMSYITLCRDGCIPGPDTLVDFDCSSNSMKFCWSPSYPAGIASLPVYILHLLPSTHRVTGTCTASSPPYCHCVVVVSCSDLLWRTESLPYSHSSAILLQTNTDLGLLKFLPVCLSVCLSGRQAGWLAGWPVGWL